LRLLILTITCFSIALYSYSQPRERFELLSEIAVTGIYQDFEIVGNRLYAATGYGFEVLNISDADNPQLLRRVSTPGEAAVIAVHNEFVYVGDHYRGIYAFDVSDLDNVRKTWTLDNIDVEGIDCRDLQIHDERLYACVWGAGVMIFDLNNPARPSYLTTYEDSPYPGGIDFQDSIAFIIDNAWESFLVADLRDPDDMLSYNQAGQRIAGFLLDVKVHGDLLLLAQGNAGMTIYGIQQPLDPSRLRRMNLEGTTWAVAAEGDYVYASCGEGGLQTIDISQPNEAEVVAMEQSVNSVQSFVLGNNANAFSSGNPAGMLHYDLSNPEEPSPGQIYGGAPVVSSLGVFSDVAYLARSEKGLTIIDVADPHRPRIISEIDSFHVTDVFINEDRLYLTTYDPVHHNFSLQSWNLYDPHNPEATWFRDLGDEIMGLKTWDEMLFIHTQPNQIELWGISDPDHPELIAEINEIDLIAFDVRADFLYGIDSDLELSIINIYNPEEPVRLGSIDGLTAGYAVESKGPLVYVADGYSGIRVYDVSRPIRIEEVAQIVTHNIAVSVVVEDGLIWVSDKIGGLQVYLDDRDAGFPEMGFIDTYGRAEMAVIVGETAYIADYYSLVICRYDSSLFVDTMRPIPPADYKIYPAYPNPFNSVVQVSFNVQFNSRLHARVFNAWGRQVYVGRTYYPRGQHNFQWEAAGFTSGSYFLDLNFYDVDGGNLVVNNVQKLIYVK